MDCKFICIAFDIEQNEVVLDTPYKIWRKGRVLQFFYYIYIIIVKTLQHNKRFSETRASPAACREPAGVQNRHPSVLYVFEHKTKNILIHAPHIRIAAFWHISNIPQGFHSQNCYNNPILYIVAIFVKYHYITGGCFTYKLIYVVRVLTARETNDCETGLLYVSRHNFYRKHDQIKTTEHIL